MTDYQELAAEQGRQIDALKATVDELDERVRRLEQDKRDAERKFMASGL